MGLEDREARLLGAVHRTFARTARWEPASGAPDIEGVTVRLVEVDQDAEFGGFEVLKRGQALMVRRDALTPQKNDLIVIPAGRWAGSWRISAAPRLARDELEWMCPVEPVPETPAP